MKDWFFEKDALIAAVIYVALAASCLFLGIKERKSYDFVFALLALLVGIVNLLRYLKKDKKE